MFYGSLLYGLIYSLADRTRSSECPDQFFFCVISLGVFVCIGSVHVCVHMCNNRPDVPLRGDCKNATHERHRLGLTLRDSSGMYIL